MSKLSRVFKYMMSGLAGLVIILCTVWLHHLPVTFLVRTEEVEVGFSPLVPWVVLILLFFLAVTVWWFFYYVLDLIRFRGRDTPYLWNEAVLALLGEDHKRLSFVLGQLQKKGVPVEVIALLMSDVSRQKADWKTVKSIFERAKDFPRKDILLSLVAAQQAVTEGNTPVTASLLSFLFQKGCHLSFVLRQFFEVSLEEGDLGRCRAIIEQARKNNSEDLGLFKAQLLLAQSGAQDNDPILQETTLRRAHLTVPDSPVITIALADKLRAQEKEHDVRDLLTKTWARHPDPLLIRFVLNQEAETPTICFQNIQHLIEERPDVPLAHWALARAAIRAQLWSVAQKPIQDLMRTHPEWAQFLLALLVHHQEHDDGQAYKLLKEGYQTLLPEKVFD